MTIFNNKTTIEVLAKVVQVRVLSCMTRPPTLIQPTMQATKLHLEKTLPSCSETARHCGLDGSRDKFNARENSASAYALESEICMSEIGRRMLEPPSRRWKNEDSADLEGP